MLIGLWTGGRAILARWEEAVLAVVVLMYFVGFVLTDTGPRLMLHIVPFVFGWAVIGLEEAGGWLDARLRATGGAWLNAPRRLLLHAGGGPIVAALVAIVLLPRTLFPLGYDQRGMRYAGQEIARRGGGSVTVAGTDARMAFYADAGFIRLPARPASGGFCGWLAEHRSANYLMIDDRAERRWGGAGGSPCLSLIKRYPRVGPTYYDLFAVRQPASSTSGSAVGARRGGDEGSLVPNAR